MTWCRYQKHMLLPPDCTQVLVQLTAPATSSCVGPDVQHPTCTCTGELCGGPHHYVLTLALVALTAIICFLMAYYDATRE